MGLRVASRVLSNIVKSVFFRMLLSTGPTCGFDGAI
jgi:hypothetical protein